MKIYCQRNELNKALNTVLPAIPVRTTSKIMEGFLIAVKGDTLSLTATDTNMTIDTRIKVDSSEEASFVVPAKLFTSVVSKLPEEDMMLEFDEKKKKLRIKSGNSQTELICFDADDFPKIKLEEGAAPIIIDKESIKKLIRKTAFSASADELNGILTGVLVEILGGRMRMVAVDTFRMAICNTPIKNAAEMSVVIPAKMIQKVEKIIGDNGEAPEMQFEIVDNKAVMKFDDTRVVLNTLNGKYIDYKRIIKNEGDIEIRVKKDDLIKAIDRASLLSSSQNNNLIKMTITDEIIEIRSLSEEGNIEEKVEIIKSGDDLNIGFNSRYMLDVLKVIEEEEIKLYMRDSISPCIVKPLTGENYLYLILPVRIS